jgi:hypothetical protein
MKCETLMIVKTLQNISYVAPYQREFFFCQGLNVLKYKIFFAVGIFCMIQPSNYGSIGTM